MEAEAAGRAEAVALPTCPARPEILPGVDAAMLRQGEVRANDVSAQGMAVGRH